jgi:hypothetical protein
MANYDVGYGKPPKHSQFKPGQSGYNPIGRKKRRAADVAAVVKETLNEPIRYRDQGRTKTTTRTELGIKKLIESAVRGDLSAAKQLLAIRAQAMRDGDAGVQKIVVRNLCDDLLWPAAEQITQPERERTIDPEQPEEVRSASPRSED